jgi:hypothetical protein
MDLSGVLNYHELDVEPNLEFTEQFKNTHNKELSEFESDPDFKFKIKLFNKINDVELKTYNDIKDYIDLKLETGINDDNSPRKICQDIMILEKGRNYGYLHRSIDSLKKLKGQISSMSTDIKPGMLS